MFVSHDIHFLVTLSEVYYLQKTDHILSLHCCVFLFSSLCCSCGVFILIHHSHFSGLFKYLIIWLYELCDIAVILLSVHGVEGKVWGVGTQTRHKHTHTHMRPFSLLEFLS